MAVVPTYESKVTLQANNGGGANTPLDVSKMFPATKPDFSKVGVALMKAQDKMDKARVLEYKNAMLQYVSDQTYGDNGYLKQLGKNALAQDEQGNGLTQRGLAGYDKASDEWFKNNNLTPRQMKLAKEEGVSVRLQYQNGMGSHVLQEGKRYQIEQCETATANAINAGLLATTPEGIGEAYGQLRQAVKTADDILGRDGDMATIAMKTSTSKFWQARFTKELLTADKDPIGGYQRAKAILASQHKDMDAATILDCQAKLRELEANSALANVLNNFKGVSALSDIPGVKEISMGSTNAKRLPKDLIFQGLVGKNTQSDGVNVSRYANGGYGISGLRMEDMLKTVKADPSLNPDKLSEKALKNKFIVDRVFNYTVGTTRFAMLTEAYGDGEKAAVAYQLGDEKVDEAVKLATKDGKPEQWMDYVKGDTANVKKVLKEVRESQEGVVRGSDGKILDPCSADYIEKLNPLRTDEQLTAFIEAHDGGYTKRNPMAKEQFRGRLRAQEVTELANKKKQYQQNFYACVTAAQNGQDMPAENYNALPISAQRWVQKLKDKRAMGDGTPDYRAYQRYKLNPELMVDMPEDDFNTFVLPLMGNKAEEISILRNACRESRGMSLDQRYLNNIKVAGGQYDRSFSPTPEVLRGSISRVFRLGKALTGTPRDNGLYWRMITLVTAEAQKRSRYSSTGKAQPLEGMELDLFLQKQKDQMAAEGIVPISMPLSNVPNRNAQDAKTVTQGIADMLTAQRSGRNIPSTVNQQEMVWGALCSGLLPEGLHITLDEIRSSFYINPKMRNEAEAQLTKEGCAITPASLLNRYVLLCCGWTPQGGGLPFEFGASAPQPQTQIQTYDWE